VFWGGGVGVMVGFRVRKGGDVVGVGVGVLVGEV